MKTSTVTPKPVKETEKVTQKVTEKNTEQKQPVYTKKEEQVRTLFADRS